MPIYAYRCEQCGFETDVLQKFSDAPITHCSQCSTESMIKKLTAPGFQLKGSGWYATDFKDKPKSSVVAESPKSEASNATTNTETKEATKGATNSVTKEGTKSTPETSKSVASASSSPTSTSSGGASGKKP